MPEHLNWDYSRNQRRHYVDDGEYYRKGKDYFNLAEIRNCTPMGFRNQCEAWGYDLFIRGKRVFHSLSVKDAKAVAETAFAASSAVSRAKRRGRMISRLS